MTNELTAFADSVGGVVEKVWGDATAAATAEVGELWTAAVEQGWYELGEAGALDLAFAAIRRLGRAASPLPLLDGYIAAEVLGDPRVAAGEIRVVAALAGDTLIEAGTAATHVLLLPSAGGTAELCPITSVTALPGLTVPAWSRVGLGPSEKSVDLDKGRAERAVAVLRLGLAARALAAAELAHELAIEHAKTRKQFGKVIGSFGAVSQRTAQCQIEVRSANLLLEEAVSQLAGETFDDALLTSEIAVAHIRRIAPFVQLGAHHTLAAIGYFDEHPAPALFRRVHADITALSTLASNQGSVADILIEQGKRLPNADLGPIGESFRDEYRQFIADHGARDKALNPMVQDPATTAALAEKGWLGFEWPEQYGGRKASLAEQVVLSEETTYNRVGVSKGLGAVQLLGASILRHGSEEQKAKFLPLIKSGEMNFCLGYSEPEAGSDLASLRTRAVRDGDAWVISGQKLWTTGAHQSDWVWLAVRTDPEATPRHAGITVFLVDIKTPGITISEHIALSGEVSCTVFYDDVRVPDSARVGDVDGGWKVIVDALAGERITMGNIAAALNRQLDDLLDFVASDTDRYVGPRGSAHRALIDSLAVRVQATRALVSAAVSASSSDAGAMFDAAMAGVMGGDLSEDFGEAMLTIFGQVAMLGRGSAGEVSIPGSGAFEYGLRQSVMYVVGGGTNDIQRGLIARGLGLPR